MPNMKGKKFLTCNFPDKQLCHASKNTYYSRTTLSNSYEKNLALILLSDLSFFQSNQIFLKFKFHI